MNLYWLGTTADSACVLSAAAMGDAVCLMAGEYNLGGDGQIYIAAFAASLTLTACHALPPPIAVLAGLAAAVLAAAGLSLVSVWLKAYRGVSVLLSTYIASAAVAPLLDSLIATRFRGEGNLLATPFIPPATASPAIMPPSSLSVLSLAGIAVCVLTHIALCKTALGKDLAIIGASKSFANYAGIRCGALSSLALVFAAAMHGLAGFIMVAGTHHTCIQGFAQGVGWSAFTAALVGGKVALPSLRLCPHALLVKQSGCFGVGRFDTILSKVAAQAGGKITQRPVGEPVEPLVGVIFSSILLAALSSASQSFFLTHFVPFDAASLIQGVAIAIIAIHSGRGCFGLRPRNDGGGLLRYARNDGGTP